MKKLLFTLIFLLTPFTVMASTSTWQLSGEGDDQPNAVYYNIGEVEHNGTTCLIATTYYNSRGAKASGGGLWCFPVVGGSEEPSGEPTIHNGANVLINIKDMNKRGR